MVTISHLSLLVESMLSKYSSTTAPFAVGRAVPAQPARRQVIGGDLQRAELRRARGRGRATAAAASAALPTPAAGRAFPLRDRAALGRRRRGRFRSVEVEQASLLAGVGLDLQRLRVLPRHVDAQRHPHQPCHPVGQARSVLRRRPQVADALALGVQRQADEVPARRRDHAPAPVLVDDRHPVASQTEVLRRQLLRGQGCGGRHRLAPPRRRPPASGPCARMPCRRTGRAPPQPPGARYFPPTPAYTLSMNDAAEPAPFSAA